ncbi:HEAT repeat-containing protein 4 [Hemicordylus capensis]|uniref:HEAT repeat-containing protein 4 n=1 Tax=Hemicordylus capensis TaxID=884348 RepID=UPI0023033157|nr:HEAT repeat-containing protein 4 [Hemicordylus capensis]XP_053126394.1 HEAT repeat-containing protein 4 [Hemicordylus capensis]
MNFTKLERMEIPTFFKSKNPFPLESALKIRVDRKNLPSRNAMMSVMKAEMPLTCRYIGHSQRHHAHYQKKFLKTIAKDLSFSKEVIQHRSPSSLTYEEYVQTGLYDVSSIVHEHKVESITAKKQRRPSRLKPLRRESIKLDIAPDNQTPTNVPLYLEECIRKAELESSHSEPSLLVYIPPPPPPPSCDPPYSQTFLTEPQEMLGDVMTKQWSKRTFQSTTKIQDPECKDLRWEECLLIKLNKGTAQWIVNNQSSWGGWIQGKPRRFRKQRYDWESIRYVLPCESDVALLNEIQTTKTASHIRIYEEKEAETLLPSYYRIPSFQSRVQRIDDPTGNNSTADKISKKTLRLVSPVKRRERLNSRVGKHSYTTQNVFEQELYFGTAKIVHQKAKKDRIFMDNNDVYCKHLPQHYPRPPELWSFKPSKKTTKRVQKGAIHWAEVPTIVEDFAQLGEGETPVPSRRKWVSHSMFEEDVSQDIRIRRTMLAQWKTAWKLESRWQAATIEGLVRDLRDIHVQNRIKAIVVCASAVLERPQPVKKGSQESVIGIEAGAKGLEVQDIPKKIQPLLRNTLFDKDAHVRMAAAVCYYAIGRPYQEAQAIMRNALIHGNSADSWAAAQALALEGITSFQVVKRILSQIFNQKDDTAEDQACLLLARLSKRTGLVHCLLASELNSYQWRHRVLACKTISRIPGSVSQDLKNKIVQLMWTDWKFEVRQAAAKALGHLQLGKEVHDQLRKKLKRGDCRMRVDALSMIGWLELMTAKLLPGFLQCFSDDFVAVRKEACWVAGILRITEERVLKCLFKMMQTDPLWKIKALAIRALGLIGQASPHLQELLLWALHYEEDPGVRREACRSIITLNMQDETVRATLLERMILEPNEMVREEMKHAVSVFDFQQEEEQEMIQEIKDKIARLSKKDLVIQKLLKLQEIIERTWHEAHRIYRDKGDVFAYKEIRDIFLDVVQTTFTGQTQYPHRKFSEVWKENLLPCPRIPSNPWTQRAFSETLEVQYAGRETRAKKKSRLPQRN